MNIFNKIRSHYQRLSLQFDKQFGWFFTNGQKAGADVDWLSR